MELHVVMAANDGYTSYMGTSILSLLENNVKQFEAICIYIIDNGISKENQKKLKEQCSMFENTNIAFFDMEKRFSTLHPIVENGWNITIYGRFFIDDIVDKSVDKVLYLDSDTIVNASLKELLLLDLTEYCLAGVVDISDDKSREFLNMDPSSHYINSGVLLVNMNKWREMDITEKLVSFVNTFPQKLPCPDQDAINAVCGNMIFLLPVKYNYGWFLSQRRLKWDYYKADFYYSYDELYDTVKDSFANVVVFHFFGPYKPWRKGECFKEFEDVFLKYYKKSPWFQKIKFASRKKCIHYYFIQKPAQFLAGFIRYLLGEKGYDRLCGLFEKKGDSV